MAAAGPADPARGRALAAGLGLLALLAVAAGYILLHPERAPAPMGAWLAGLTGANPHPVKLRRPASAPLSALATLGRDIFYDTSLSASGRLSCASCHSPGRDYGPPNGLAVQLGGAHMAEAGVRPPPSLAYLYRQPPFSIGPDPADTEVAVNLDQAAAQARAAPRAAKTAGAGPATPAIVPQGGLFWDGRADTLQAQALGPATNPAEMANASEAEVAQKLLRAPYRTLFAPLFGPNILANPSMLVAEATSAVARYQIEDVSFHRFDSRYDHWLEGKARLSPAELRGMRLFNDPAKANCAGCHLSQPSPDGLPPLFTDTQYEALGVPRNAAIPANRDPGFFDMGLCGPFRTDLAGQTQYCGMFLTPTLRNAARRPVYFHNGVYRRMKDVLRFYAWRSTRPQAIYPKDAAGHLRIADDLPPAYRANLDTADAPFDRRRGSAPAITEPEMDDIIAFLKTLNDGDGARR